MKEPSIASLSLTNTSGIYIHSIDEDYVEFSYSGDVKTRRVKLHTNTKGNYFRADGVRWYLDEFMKH